MRSNILINFAEEDGQKLKPVIDRLREKFPGVGCGEEAARNLRDYNCIVNLYTPAAEKSAGYRRVVSYAVKHHVDSLLFHVKPEQAVFDLEIAMQTLLAVLGLPGTPAADAAQPYAAQAESEETKKSSREPEEKPADKPKEKPSEMAADKDMKPDKPAESSRQVQMQQVVSREEEEIEKAADQRSLVRDRMYAEGMQYLNGIEREPDAFKAFDCFRQAANAGSVLAQYQLSVCYDQGIGVRRNASEAARWCEMAAFGGYGKAQCVIGYCYETGQGVSRNMREAVRWYQAAAKQGEIEAINNLAFCYQKGRGVARDTSKAIELYEEAARAGHSSAQYNLGFCYWYGEGVESDKQRAIELFHMSAQSGNQKAQQMMKILNLHSYVK